MKTSKKNYVKSLHKDNLNNKQIKFDKQATLLS